jgi:hypothetical protein
MDTEGLKRLRTSLEIQKQKRENRQEENKDTQKMLNSYASDPGKNFSLYGSSKEKANQAANLTQVGAMTGLNMKDIGGMSQQYGQNLQNRLGGNSAAANYMVDQRNRNMANVGRRIAGSGISGGAAASAMNTAQNEADASVAKELQGFDRQNNQELFNWIKRNQKVTGEALAMGADKGLAQGMDTSAGQGLGFGGTVICGELYRQGYMDADTYTADAEFGYNLMINDTFAYFGYYCWAIYIVSLMQKSKLFTKLVSLIALPWARHISGDKNIIGRTLMCIGVPVCRLIGEIRYQLAKV